MKKITLMLCACAMAFAGLLVSCNNGTEKYVDTTSVYNNYRYKVTGSVTETTSTGAIAKPDTTSDVYTFTKATGSVSWTDNETSKGDVPTYNIWFGGQADRVFTNASSVETKTYTVWKQLPDTVGKLYKLDDGYYIDLDRNKDRYVKVTLDGEFGDDEFKLSYNYTIDNLSAPSTTTVNSKTYSGTITFTSVAE